MSKSQNSMTKQINRVTKEPRPLTKQEAADRQAAIEEWISQRDPSEYRVASPQVQEEPPMEKVPDGYKPDWKIQSIPFPDAPKWGSHH